jgi:tetratricopeptide (TPR) repeat protein
VADAPPQAVSKPTDRGGAASKGRRRPELRFEIQVGDGFGSLLLRPGRFYDWLEVEHLELAIPNVSFPLDITRGIKQFQRERLKVVNARLAVYDDGVQALLQTRDGLLHGAGFEDVRVRFLGTAAEISGQARVAERVADFTARAWLRADSGLLQLTITDARVFGFLRRPAPALLHDLGCVLLAAVPAEAAGEAATGGAVVQGLGSYVARPLNFFLLRSLPPAGWRMPDTASLRISEARVLPERIELEYSTTGGEVDVGWKVEGEASLLVEGAERFRYIDDKLLRGDLDGAIVDYRFELGRQPDFERFLSGRLLAILCARDSTHRQAEREAREILERWPQFINAQIVLAAVAVAQGRNADAAKHYERVRQISEDLGDDEDAVRAALAAARLVRTTDERAAIGFYERVLERRPNHIEAVDALAKSYRAQENWSSYIRLWKRRIEATANPIKKARSHVELAKVYVDKLANHARAREELEAAVLLHDQDVHAWDTLADVCRHLGDVAGAAQALTRVAQVHEAKRDGVGRARVEVRLGGLWEQLGELDLAVTAYRRALEFLSEDCELVERYAAVAARRGNDREAVEYYVRLRGMCSPEDERFVRAQQELARLAILRGDLEIAEEYIEQLPAVPPDILLELASLQEEDGQYDRAAETYRAAAAAQQGAYAAAAHLKRAELLDRLGMAEEAREALQTAARSAPDEHTGETAARALMNACREEGDRAAEARWIDALLARAGGIADRPDLLLRRAELAFAAGDAVGARAFLDENRRLSIEPWSLGTERFYADILGAIGDSRGQAQMLEAMLSSASHPSQRVELLVASASAWAACGNADKALAHARAAADIDPDSPAVQSALREAVWQARAWDEIVAMYEGALDTLAPAEQARAALRLGMGLERLGRTEEAVASFLVAVKSPAARGKSLAAAWRHLAEAYERLGDYRHAARAHATGAIDARTGAPLAQRADAHYHAAEILYRRMGRPQDALVELLKALELEPAHAASLDALESIYGEQGAHDRVAEVLQRKVDAIAANPERQKVLLMRLAELQLDFLSQPQAARETYRRLLTLAPDYQPAHEFLAQYGGGEREDDYGGDDDDSVDDGLEEELNNLATLAAEAVDSGEVAEAETYLKQALTIAPIDSQQEFLVALEELYQSQQRWGDLLAVLSRRAELLDVPEARVAMEKRRVHVLLDRLHDRDAAAALCRAALNQWPDEPGFQQLLIQALTDLPGRAALAEDASAPSGRSFAAPPTEPGYAAEGAAAFYQPEPSPGYEVAYPDSYLDLAASSDQYVAPAEDLLAPEQFTTGPEAVPPYPDDGSSEGQTDAYAEQAAAYAQAEDGYAYGGRADYPGEYAYGEEAAYAGGDTYGEQAGYAAGDGGDNDPFADEIGPAAEFAGAAVSSDGQRPAGAGALGPAVASRAAQGPGDWPAPSDPDWAEQGRAVAAAAGFAEQAAGAAAADEADMSDLIDPGGEENLSGLAEADDDFDLGGDDAPQAEDDDGKNGAVSGRESPFSVWRAPTTKRKPAAAQSEAKRLRRPPRTPYWDPFTEGPTLPGRAPLKPAVAAGAFAKVEKLQRLLHGLPLRDRRRLAIQQQLGELYLKIGDVDGARESFEAILREDAADSKALRSILDIYRASGDWRRTVKILMRVANLETQSKRKADYLFQAGEIYEQRLDDYESATDAYLRASDLDPDHAPLLRKLVDYYWAVNDRANLLDVGAELDKSGELISPTTDPGLLVRVAMVALLEGNKSLATRTVSPLGSSQAATLAVNLAAAVGTLGAPEEIAGLGRAICQASALSFEAVREELDGFAMQRNEGAQALLLHL